MGAIVLIVTAGYLKGFDAFGISILFGINVALAGAVKYIPISCISGLRRCD